MWWVTSTDGCYCRLCSQNVNTPLKLEHTNIQCSTYEESCCRVFSASFGKGAIAWYKQLPHGGITSFVDLSARYAHACYVLQIREPKHIDSLFEVVKLLEETLKQCVGRFEGGIRLVVDPDQCMAYIAFIKRLMHDPDTYNHPMLSNLVASRIKKYKDAQ